MGKKVIFLDFDGVLNNWYPNYHTDEEVVKDILKRRNAKNFIYDYLYEKTDIRVWSVYDLDYEKVVWLNHIIEKTDSDIVFSTAWRGDGCKNLALYLTLTGFLYPEKCIGCTIHHKSGKRGIEIQDWLDKNQEYDKYVVIDDELFDIFEYHPIENIQKVWGLNKDYAEFIIEKLT